MNFDIHLTASVQIRRFRLTTERLDIYISQMAPSLFVDMKSHIFPAMEVQPNDVTGDLRRFKRGKR